MRQLVHLLSLACLLAGSAAAEEFRPRSTLITGNLGATSDFVFRGLSLTRGKPAVQASLTVEFPRQFYLGGFVANADPNAGPGPGMEFDAWLGKYWRFGDQLSLDLLLSRYLYPDDPRRVTYNRSEVSATLGFRDRLFASAIYSPNVRAVSATPGYRDTGAWAFEVSARHAFDDRWSVTAGAGHYALGRVYGHDYHYFNATLIAALDPWELQLAWLGTDGGARRIFPDEVIGQRLTLTALWRFAR